MSTLLLATLSAFILPLLALLAILLRRELVSGKAKVILLGVGIILLGYAVLSDVLHHRNDLGLRELIISLIVGVITFFILASFNKHHKHNKEGGGVKGIVLSEAFHSLIDGAVIGATYLVNPVLGGAATLGIVVHEFPKILGTLALLRGLNLSIKKTIVYGMLAQSGAPVAALFIFILGKEVNPEQFHTLEIASLSSLATIILWILYLEITYHKKHSHGHNEHGHSHNNS
jgi:zinc and cadmium transporter